MSEMPNLFESTGELSQDAFIAWLLKWADPKTAQMDSAMHGVGKAFLQKLLQLHGVELDVKGDVEVHRQYKNVDLLVVVDEHAILIEDKIHAQEHSDQLNRYIEELKQDKQLGKMKLLPVFLKTGSQSKYGAAEKAGYKLFLRKAFLDFLETVRATVKNDILEDFYRNILRIENRIGAFRELPPDNWDYDAWVGFYKSLQSNSKSFPDFAWDYVPNQSGGFVGAWWGFHEWKKAEVYLQIEQGKLCFKISVDEKDVQSEKRDERRDLLLGVAGQKSAQEIARPQRMGKGTWMTCCVVNRNDWMILNEKGLIDCDATI